MASTLKFDDITDFTPDVKRVMDEESELISLDIERAGRLKAEEKYEEAAKMCKEILKRDSMQSKMSKDTLVQACLYELLGDCLGESGQVAEARSYLTKAIHIRDPVEYGGLGRGNRLDAACLRERLAYLWEAVGNMDEAKELRLRGEAKGDMLCSNWICHFSALRRRDELRACTGCYSVFYHSNDCQRSDWTQRHRVTCKAYQSKQKGRSRTAA